MTAITDDICELLDSYNGRDKVVRLACYACKLWGCYTDNKGWQLAGSKFSSTRMALRLFDDIPMIRHTYNYGFGSHESSSVAAFLGVLANAVDQLFLPVEKLLFLHEVGVLKFTTQNADKLETLSTSLWAGSLYISLLQTLRSMHRHWWCRSCLKNSEGESARRKVDIRLYLETIAVFKLCLDIVHAVSCLPQGWLWGERIGATKVASIATTSSCIGIALYFAKKRLLK